MKPKFNLIQEFCLRLRERRGIYSNQEGFVHKTKPRPDLSEEPTGRGR